MARPRYIRHRTFDRLRHSTRFLKWLDTQADRLSTTAEAIFNLMVSLQLSYEEVEDLADLPEAPSNNTAPAITGTAEVGQTLTVTPGTWSGEPSPSLSYQWFQVDGETETAISGATTTTYEVAAGDVGLTLIVRETATNASGSASADSDPTATVTEPA